MKCVNCLINDAAIKTLKLCRKCYSKQWGAANKEHRANYARTLYRKNEWPVTKKRQDEARQLYPLKMRCRLLKDGMRARAKLYKYEFDASIFTVKYLMDRLTKNPNCECCNKILDLGFKPDKKFNQNSPSMDRVDSTRGYTIDNTAIVCWRCNRIKQDAIASELRTIAEYIENWQKPIIKGVLG